MPRALVALGANLGDREETLRKAAAIVSAAASGGSFAVSSFHQTSPVGGPSGQQPFLNAAIALDTALPPDALFALLQSAELQLGRQPAQRWGPRAIDLDLLLYDDRVVCTDQLRVPHPRLAFRRFMLAPAAEVAAEMIHPQIGWSVRRLLEHLESTASYVALVGPPSSGKSALAQAVADAVGGHFLADPMGGEPQTPAADPSGPAYGRQIQFLDRAAVLAGWSEARRCGRTLSDFFFDQCLAYAELSLHGDSLARFHQQWAARRESIARPKLLVVLDSWEAAVAVAGGQQLPQPASGVHGDLRRALLTLAAQPDQGPVLYAGRNDFQTQFEEITAAITAME